MLEVHVRRLVQAAGFNVWVYSMVCLVAVQMRAL